MKISKRLKNAKSSREPSVITSVTSFITTIIKSKLDEHKLRYLLSTLPNFLRTSTIKFRRYLKVEKKAPKKLSPGNIEVTNSEVIAIIFSNYFKCLFITDHGIIPALPPTVDRMGNLAISDHCIFCDIPNMDGEEALSPGSI